MANRKPRMPAGRGMTDTFRSSLVEPILPMMDTGKSTTGASIQVSPDAAQLKLDTSRPKVKTRRLKAGPAAEYRISGAPARIRRRKWVGRPVISKSEKTVVISQSRTLIDLLQEALDYTPRPGSNQTAPELWTDFNLGTDKGRAAIVALVAELKELNTALAARSRQKKKIIEVKKHLNTFLGAYAKSAGTAAGVLTVTVIAGWLSLSRLK